MRPPAIMRLSVVLQRNTQGWDAYESYTLDWPGRSAPYTTSWPVGVVRVQGRRQPREVRVSGGERGEKRELRAREGCVRGARQLWKYWAATVRQSAPHLKTLATGTVLVMPQPNVLAAPRSVRQYDASPGLPLECPLTVVVQPHHGDGFGAVVYKGGAGAHVAVDGAQEHLCVEAEAVVRGAGAGCEAGKVWWGTVWWSGVSW